MLSQKKDFSKDFVFLQKSPYSTKSLDVFAEFSFHLNYHITPTNHLN